jgi:hypothetical protein
VPPTCRASGELQAQAEGTRGDLDRVDNAEQAATECGASPVTNADAGVTTFTEWRRQYPAEVQYRIRRITAREDVAVVELSISYNGGPWQYGVQLLEFRDDKVAPERIYVMEGWEAPDWRALWRSETPADPPE